jgi:FkbM family methyltransferase
MSIFQNLKAKYATAEIDKNSFIQAMHKQHSVLFDTSTHLANCNIKEFRLTENGVVATFKNPEISMVCPPADTRIAPIEAFNFGDYEHDEIQLILRIVAKLGGAGTRFFDVGANAGFYSLALAKTFPGICGTAFEPIPQTYGYLKANFALNGLTSVTTRNLALSDKEGELVFYTYPTQSGASSMARNLDSLDVVEVKCRVVKMDDYCAQHGDSIKSIDFIKCDVEGAELFVFKGGENILKRDTPLVFTEMLRKWSRKFHYHPNDMIFFFSTLEYDCFVIRGDCLEPIASVTAETLDTNFLFLHRSKHSDLIEAFVQ